MKTKTSNKSFWKLNIIHNKSYEKGFQAGKQEALKDVEKIIEKRIARVEHCRDTCESQELDELEIVKKEIEELKSKLKEELTK